MEHYGFCGGDVSKGMCNFVLVNNLGSELEPNFQLDDNREGHDSLFTLLKQFREQHGLEKIIIGLESTGGYENNWYKGLRARSETLSLEVFRINPKRIYHESKTEGRRSITDGISAQIIAGYLRKNYGTNDLSLRRLATDDTGHDSLKSLHKYIQRLIKQNTRTKNSLEKLLYQSLPEVLSLKGEKYSNWFLELLRRYPSRKAILEADIEGLTSIKHLGSKKATLLLDSLKLSIAGTTDRYIAIVIEEHAIDIQQLNLKINRLKKELHELANEKLGDSIDIVQSIRGIAQDTAVPILLEVGDISRFAKGKNLVAYWGINPTFKQSGDKHYYVGMSKEGSPAARGAIYNAAKNVVIHEPYFKTIYHKNRKKDKSHNDALGVVMNKLTRVLFGMLKSMKEFDAGVDTFNQLKKEASIDSKTVNGSETKERRYQKDYESTPTSWKQKRKRKKEHHVSS